MGIKSQLESILFISAKPMGVKQLAELLGKASEEIKQAGDELVEEYRNQDRGVQIIKDGSHYQMASSPDNAKVVRDFIKDETTGELSKPSLEALTIIAYRGPIAKTDLDRIRGVNCSLILRNLLIRGLIEGKPDKTKGQVCYNVTLDFVRFLGISDISQLPDYEKLSQDDAIDRLLNKSESELAPPSESAPLD